MCNTHHMSVPLFLRQNFKWHLAGNFLAHVLLLTAYQIRIWLSLDWWSGYVALPCGPMVFHKAVYLPLKMYAAPMCSLVNAAGSPSSSVDGFVFVFVFLSVLFWSVVTLGIHRISMGFFSKREQKTGVKYIEKP